MKLPPPTSKADYQHPPAPLGSKFWSSEEGTEIFNTCLNEIVPEKLNTLPPNATTNLQLVLSEILNKAAQKANDSVRIRSRVKVWNPWWTPELGRLRNHPQRSSEGVNLNLEGAYKITREGWISCMVI